MLAEARAAGAPSTRSAPSGGGHRQCQPVMTSYQEQETRARSDARAARGIKSAPLARTSSSVLAARRRAATPDTPLLASLNPEQRAAVTTTEGPLLVLAGAGTGKTRVITVRIAHLLRRGVAPESVLAVTFTNKAAREMRERVGGAGRPGARGGPDGRHVPRVLRAAPARARRARSGSRAASRSATPPTSSRPCKRRAARAARARGARCSRGALQARISLAKNRLQTPEAFLAERPRTPATSSSARAWQRYDEHLRRTRTLDFDDLLLARVRLLREHAERARRTTEQRFRYVLVDEYQDTNGPQYEIVRAIAGGHRNLCVVGDDDQSIYGWRGADVRKILGFEQRLPGRRRSCGWRRTTARRSQILDAANRVIAPQPGAPREDAALRAAARASRVARRAAARTRRARPTHVVARDRRAACASKAQPLADFAILFRTQTQPRPFEAAAARARVPYVLVGGMSFFDRKEVRDVLAYLQAGARTRATRSSLLRVINAPPRGVGKATVERVARVRDASRASRPARPSSARPRSRACRRTAVDAAAARCRDAARESAREDAGTRPRRLAAPLPRASTTAPRSSAATPTR